MYELDQEEYDRSIIIHDKGVFCFNTLKSFSSGYFFSVGDVGDLYLGETGNR